MEDIANNNAPVNQSFCGLHALISHLKTITTKTAEQRSFDEINIAMDELYRLKVSLSRVRYELASIDKADFDRAIHFWRRGA